MGLNRVRRTHHFGLRWAERFPEGSDPDAALDRARLVPVPWDLWGAFRIFPGRPGADCLFDPVVGVVFVLREGHVVTALGSEEVDLPALRAWCPSLPRLPF